MKTSVMTHWERVRAALRGEEVDRPPISLWRHWPVDDESPAALAHVSVRWQRDYDFDLVKFMPTGTYGIEDWGAETIYRPTPNGTRTVVKFGVTRPDGWPRLAPLDVTRGYLGRQIEALRLTAEALGETAPIMQTVFSPLTTARKLAGDVVFAHMRQHPEKLKMGLQIIAETTARFAVESLRAGATGLFFATQNASFRLMNDETYREFGMAYDLMVLDAVADMAEFNILHIHGQDVMFDLMTQYPVEAINWHDRLSGPSLAQAREHFAGLLIGGLEERELLWRGPVSEIAHQVRDAVQQTHGRGFMLGPGCVLPIQTPHLHIQTAIDALTSL